MDYLLPLFVAASFLFILTVASVYLAARWIFLWTASMVSAGIDRVIARAGGGAMTRLHAYALARGMSDQEAQWRLGREVDRLAWWTEGLITLPLLGPVGLDAFFGLVPFAGDAFSAWLGLRLVARGIRFGLPPEVVSKLLANVLTDALLGAVPFLGDLADIWFRSNTRNATLIRDHLLSTTTRAADATGRVAANASNAAAV
jgi:Domain of unknown function (DUF4112)